MRRISPVKVIAGIAAATLAVAVLFFGSNARQVTFDIMSIPRAHPPATNPQTSQQVQSTTTPSGSRVIPIGVVSSPSSANVGQSSGH